jgi:membrane-bound lytic murein transglycosylase F
MWTIIRLALLVVTLLLIQGCDNSDALQRIQDRGRLLVITRNSPTTYYVDKSGPAGFEYELSRRFAEQLGVELDMENHYSLAAIFDSLRRGQVAFAAAGLSITQERQQEFRFSRPYFQVQAQVVYRSGSRKPRNIDDLDGGRLVVIADSSHAETLALLQGQHPTLQWEAIDGAEPLDLMEMVSEGSANYAVVDSTELDAHQRFHPRLRKGFDLGDPANMAWVLPAGPDHEALLQRVDEFLLGSEQDGSLALLKSKYFTSELGLNPVGVQTFNRKMRLQLPEVESLIREVADEYQMEWHLLAAIAYQESHWNPLAQSPTGVRGLMMLTTRTAREMGIENRLDPAQSLRGGVRYLKKLKRRLPADIEEPDRTWFALAAYNIGRGHLEDARVITERQGGNPDIWEDVAQRLPLLQRSQYYRDTRYGYARGSEPVKYIKNVRHYQKILAWSGIRQIRSLPPISTDSYVPDVLKVTPLSAL